MSNMMGNFETVCIVSTATDGTMVAQDHAPACLSRKSPID